MTLSCKDGLCWHSQSLNEEACSSLAWGNQLWPLYSLTGGGVAGGPCNHVPLSVMSQDVDFLVLQGASPYEATCEFYMPRLPGS